MAIGDHCMPMCTGIMDIKDIPYFNFRQHPVNREFIVIFAKAACNVILMVILTTGCPLLGGFLFALFLWLTRKRVNVLSYPYAGGNTAPYQCI